METGELRNVGDKKVGGEVLFIIVSGELSQLWKSTMYYMTIYKNTRGSIESGNGDLVGTSYGILFEGLRGEEQKNGGRSVGVSSTL